MFWHVPTEAPALPGKLLQLAPSMRIFVIPAMNELLALWPCYLLKKSVMQRPTSTVSLAFFLPGCAFCAAGIPSLPAPSMPAAVLPLFAASLQVSESPCTVLLVILLVLLGLLTHA